MSVQGPIRAGIVGVTRRISRSIHIFLRVIFLIYLDRLCVNCREHISDNALLVPNSGDDLLSTGTVTEAKAEPTIQRSRAPTDVLSDELGYLDVGSMFGQRFRRRGVISSESSAIAPQVAAKRTAEWNSIHDQRLRRSERLSSSPAA